MFNKLKIQQLEAEIEKLTDDLSNEKMDLNIYKNAAERAHVDLKQLKEENSSLSSHIDTLEKEINRLEDENMRIRQAYNIEVIKNKL